MRHAARNGLLAVAVALAAVGLPEGGAAQQPFRRQRPTAFPFAVSLSGALNFMGARASEQGAICIDTACITHSLGNGPAGMLGVQIPLPGTLGIGLSADVVALKHQQCLPNGACITGERVYAFRGRAQLLVRLKARAPVFFGFGVAAMRSDPAALAVQTAPTTEIGGAITVGADFSAGPRVRVRVAWTSHILQTDDTGVPDRYTVNSTVHDGALSIGALIPIGG